jgi:hypothetical protein
MKIEITQLEAEQFSIALKDAIGIYENSIKVVRRKRWRASEKAITMAIYSSQKKRLEALLDRINGK